MAISLVPTIYVRKISRTAHPITRREHTIERYQRIRRIQDADSR